MEMITLSGRFHPLETQKRTQVGLFQVDRATDALQHDFIILQG
jgi:hypothetical protein